MGRLTITLVVVAVLTTLFAPAIARGDAVVSDCTDNGNIDGKYSSGQYRRALRNIPSDVDEYTDCRSQINEGLRASARNSGSKSSTSARNGASGATGKSGKSNKSSKRRDGNGAAAGGSGGSGGSGPGAVGVGDTSVRPGDSGGGSDGIPTPLLIVLILLGAGAIGGGGWAIRSRVLQRGQT